MYYIKFYLLSCMLATVASLNLCLNINILMIILKSFLYLILNSIFCYTYEFNIQVFQTNKITMYYRHSYYNKYYTVINSEILHFTIISRSFNEVGRSSLHPIYFMVCTCKHTSLLYTRACESIAIITLSIENTMYKRF